MANVVRLRRQMARYLKNNLLPGTGYNLGDIELLMHLYEARMHFDPAEPTYSDDVPPRACADGYVELVTLIRYLGLSTSAFSRRLSELVNEGILEVRGQSDVEAMSARLSAKPDRRKKYIRLSDRGVEVITPIYARYEKLCALLMRDIPHSDQEVVMRLCNQIK